MAAFVHLNRERFVDLSHTIFDGLVTYPRLPSPVICDYLSRESSRAAFAPGVEFQIDRIEMVGNTGTYLDSPFHRYADGRDLSELELPEVANLPGVRVTVPASALTRAIGPEAFTSLELGGRAVLVHTGWDQHWGKPAYLSDNPHLTAEAAKYLQQAGAALVGIDSLNIDALEDGQRPVHSTLLANNILIVEHLMGLQHLPEKGFRFFAVPVKMQRCGTFPVRAFAILEET